MTIEFEPWPKTARLFRDGVITEKIDGTNACVGFTDGGVMFCQSRKRLITPDMDNHGFAKWCHGNYETLWADLGPGRHFGEWWGAGIQRGYWRQGTDRTFSLFNLDKWYGAAFATPSLSTVPLLYRGTFDTEVIRLIAALLADSGSAASPRYPYPEGICIYHTASRTVYKYTLDGDDQAKSERAVA